MTAVAQAVSRNSPCPCGSGRRYKDCHGALGASAGASPISARTSTYRAPPAEWEGMAESEADRLGSLMERALAEQLAGHNEEAARRYREVLERAPRTHDALHMLGVIEHIAGNLEEAERLIEEALSLRPAYPTIKHNLELVHDALAARDRAPPEELCARALPLLFELALQPISQDRPAPRIFGGDPTVHLIGHVGATGADDGWLLRRIATLIAPSRPTLWVTASAPIATVDGARAIGIDVASGFVPRGGTHVFVGLGLADLDWIEQSDADRVVVVCTAAPPSRCLETLRAIARDGARSVDLVFTSAGVAERFGGIGSVLPLPIELSEGPAPRDDVPAPFVAGVIGQDGPDIEESHGHELLSALAQHAGALAVYDPGRLRYTLGGNPAVRCVPRSVSGLAPFMTSLHCFVHRLRPWWEEGDGRALLIAMASGVPVLCPRRSVLAAEIRDGVDALLYDDDAHACNIVAKLKRAPAWARSLGAAGRTSALERFDPATLASRYRETILRRSEIATATGAVRQRFA